jgi:hypothetical protein
MKPRNIFLCLFSHFSIFYSLKFGLFRLASFFRKTPTKPKSPNINGFYGLIGPKINITKKLSLYDLFTGDGVIQGVFINHGNLVWQEHTIQTEKIKYERIFGKMSKSVFLLPLMLALHHLHIIPNVLGLANTAILNVNNRTYSLFERDLPYELSVNYSNAEIQTIGKRVIQGIHCFSGHSKYHPDTGIISTLEYDYIRKTVNIYQLDTEFRTIHKKTIQTTYLPITHDYLVYGDHSECLLFCDSPFVIQGHLILHGKIPIVLDHALPTYIHTYNFTDGTHNTYLISERGYYIFHFSKVEVDHRKLVIYGSLYDKLDFNSIDICGKYRRIEIPLEVETGVGVVIQDILVEDREYNLDFPVLWNNTVILRNIEISERGGTRINGFVLMDETDGLRVKQEIFYDDLCFCGEPAVCYDASGEPYLVSFAYDAVEGEGGGGGEGSVGGWFVMIHLKTFQMIKKELPVRPTIGFHSIFI